MNNHFPLTLDRIMFSVPLETATIIDESKFLVNSTASGSILTRFYNSERTTLPYLLTIKINHSSNEVVINVSSKCLRDRYPELISANTIGILLKAINKLGIINLDIDRTIMQAVVLSCDVTQDRPETLSTQKMEVMRLSVIKANWTSTRYSNGILFVKRDKNEKPTGHSLTLYDKHAEMMKSSNKRFRESVSNLQQILDHFKGKTRYELKLTKKKAIKDTLHIGDTKLRTVLSASTNAIDKTMSQLLDLEIVRENQTFIDGFSSIPRGRRAVDAYKNNLLCKECNYDLERVRLVLGQLLSSKTSLIAASAPYRQIIINRTRGQ